MIVAETLILEMFQHVVLWKIIQAQLRAPKDLQYGPHMTAQAHMLPWEQWGACDVPHSQTGAVNFPSFNIHESPLPGSVECFSNL